MGRQHSFWKESASSAALFTKIVKHIQLRYMPKGTADRRVFFEQLAQALMYGRTSKAMNQAWGRWHAGRFPNVSEAARLIEHGRTHWQLDNAFHREAEDLLNELRAKCPRVPPPPRGSHPLGAHQPKTALEVKKLAEELEFTRAISSRLAKAIEAHIPTPSKTSRPSSAKALAIFRVGILKHLSETVVEINTLGLHKGAGALARDREWPNMLRAAGRDIGLYLNATARALEAGAALEPVAKKAVDRLVQ